MMNKRSFFICVCTTVSLILTLVYAQTLTPHVDNKAATNSVKSRSLAVSCPPNLVLPADISCRANITVNTPTSSCNLTALSYTLPDSSPVNVSLPIPASINLGVFPAGIYQITWNISEDCGPSTTCNQTIKIDTVAPMITCPDDLSVGNSLNARRGGNRNQMTEVEVLQPEYADLCTSFDDIVITNDYNNTDNATDLYPLGTTVVCWTATDLSQNSASCCMNIVVYDDTPPTLVCPDTLYNECVASFPYESLEEFLTAGGTVSDDVALDSLSFDWVSDVSNNLVCPEIIERTYMVSDTAGNTQSCIQRIFITDNTAPTAMCKNITVYLDEDGEANLDPKALDNGSFDNCNYSLRFSTNAPLFFGCNDATSNMPISFQLVVTDTCGNTASCTARITVRDTITPTIICPNNITVNTNNNVCFATNVSLIIPEVDDNCLIQSVIPRLNNTVVNSNTMFSLGVNTVTWTVTDVNQRTATCTQTVSVRDIQRPNITCPDNQNVGLNTSCQLIVPNLIGQVVSSDNCSVANTIQNPIAGTILSGINHNQTSSVIVTVTDASGNSNSCTVVLTAKDQTPPALVCNTPLTISISDQIQVPALFFVRSASDNCSTDIVYEVKRAGNICGGNTADTFSPYLNLCCDDVNKTIAVVVKAIDGANNATECNANVRITDKLAPVLPLDRILPDISISCQYPLNVNDLSAFGSFVSRSEVRKNIVIADPENPFYPNGIAGKDGVYEDNCPGVAVAVTSRNLLNMCNIGQIKRDFVLTDNANNITKHTQTIYVINVTPFKVTDITWPNHVDFNNCNVAEPSTSITGMPTFKNIRCSQVAATYADQTFSHPASCRYIRRTWTVIDWCQFQTNSPNSPGKWTYVQNIYVKNNVAPVIDPKVCRDTIICTPGTQCTANVVFQAKGSDDCLPVNISWSYKIDLFNNGGNADLSGNGSIVNQNFAIGTHKLTWTAKDGCGNTSSCAHLFTIRDCKAPSAVALNGIAVNLTPPMAMASVWAKDLNQSSSDNCTPPAQLRFSFSSNVNDTQRTFTCDSLGQKSVVLWVTDLAGNQTKVTTFVSVQDQQNLCNQNRRLNISGNIYTENKLALAHTKITIDGGETERSFMTDQKGHYTFDNLAMFNDYEISPIKNDNHQAGVSTLDIVLIQRHILGLDHLDSPYKMIAADINHSQSISAADLIEMRKLILGLQSTFTNNHSWRFIPTSFSLDTNEPWQYLEKAQYRELQSNMTSSDFIAVKIGDVNGNAIENEDTATIGRSKNAVTMLAEDVALEAGTSISIPFYAHDLNHFKGFQATLELSSNIEYLDIEAGSIHISEDHVGLIKQKGKQYLTFSFDDIDGLNIDSLQPIFNLVVLSHVKSTASKELHLHGAITKALAIDENFIENPLNLSFYKTTSFFQNEVAQNYPNPFRDETVIPISIQTAGLFELSIFDSNGKNLYSQKVFLNSGLNQITLNESQLGKSSGVLYSRIKNENLNQIVKMLRIE